MAIIKRPFRIKNADGSWNEHYFRTSEDMIVNAIQNLDYGGYRKLPGGLIIQWGSRTTGSFSNSVLSQMTSNFPITFPNRCMHVFLTVRNNEDSREVHCWGMGNTLSSTEYVVYSPNRKRCNVSFLAIGM